MAGSLDVHLNRGEPHSVEVADGSFEADGDFDIVLHNHGAALHVHLNLADDLAGIAGLGSANHYVDEGAVRRVHVSVDESRVPARGRLKIVTGYGSETAYVTVSLVEPGGTEDAVRVDERLAKPQPDESEPIVDPDRVPVIALGVVAVLIAALSVVFIDDPVVLAGVLVVLLGVGVAGAIMART